MRNCYTVRSHEAGLVSHRHLELLCDNSIAREIRAPLTAGTTALPIW